MRRTLLKAEEVAAKIARQGLTLEERLRLDPFHAQSGKFDESLVSSVQNWRSWFNRDGATPGGWENFLAEHRLNERKLIQLSILSGPNQKLPPWTVTLRRICDHLQNADIKPDSRMSLSENLAFTLVGFAWDELSAHRNIRVLSPKAGLALRQSLLRRLAQCAKQAADWELLAANAGRGLTSNSRKKSAGDFQDYFFASSASNEALRLLRNYPALARLWAVQIESWREFIGDFLQHANAFARRIGLTRERGRAVISSLETDLSDPHDGNRTVMRVRFGENGEWFYKPRPGRQERAWFDLLCWINARGFPLPFRIVDVICGDKHFWMESVRSHACRNRNEMTAFCFRLGALMCLVHLLRGVDFHPANLVTAGDQPVLVDCETLLHPDTSLPKYAREEERSILRTGMLALVKGIPAMAVSHRWKKDQFLEDIIAGFVSMHEFVRRDALVFRHLQRWSSRLRKFPARRIYRPTVHYYAMLEHSLAPSVLTSGCDRSLYLYACCRDGIVPPRHAREESAALEIADIPAFRSRPHRINLDLSEKSLTESVSLIRRGFVEARFA